MRLLIALPDPSAALAVKADLDSSLWDVRIASDGCDAMELLSKERFDLLLLHQCLAKADGPTVGEWLKRLALVTPPRVLYAHTMEVSHAKPDWADAAVQAGCTVSSLCDLLRLLAQKPLPILAAAHKPAIHENVRQFLDQIGLHHRYKGRMYAAWLLERLIPSPMLEDLPISRWYAACADCFHATPASVERCLRVAVESVFTQGSIDGIDRFFGATVDPERGKPTNRAFLLQAAHQLRLTLPHSLADTRSPNKSEMHHSPAAPTKV